MEDLPTAAEAVELLTDANKAPRAAHFDILIETIKQALQAGQRTCSFRSWCLQDADLNPIRAKDYVAVLADQVITVSW